MEEARPQMKQAEQKLDKAGLQMKEAVPHMKAGNEGRMGTDGGSQAAVEGCMATDEGIKGLNYEHSVNLRGNKGQDYPSITISLERMSEKKH